MKRCEGCRKIIWFWQRKDIEYIDNNKIIMYYHWNCRYPKVKW
jgi:hypothetical protein